MGLSDLCVYSLAFSHQLPARNQRDNDFLLQVQLAVFLLAIYLNTFNEKKDNPRTQKSTTATMSGTGASKLSAFYPNPFTICNIRRRIIRK